MTGAELYAYLVRRIGEGGATVPADRSAELYELLSDGRDLVLQRMSTAAPFAVQTLVTYELVPGTTRDYRIPTATADPYRLLFLRDRDSGEFLTPAAMLDNDDGDYELLTPRTLRLANGITVTGPLEGMLVLQGNPITSSTAEPDIGVPEPLHRAVGKAAAWLFLESGEEGNGSRASRIYEEEMTRLEEAFGSFDASAGLAVRHGLMRSIGTAHGDTLY